MTPQDRQNYGEAGNVTIMAADGAVVLTGTNRFCKLTTLASTTFTALVDQFERRDAKGAAASRSVLFSVIPTNGQTFVVGDVTYTFKTAVTSPNDVLIGIDVNSTVANLVAAISVGDAGGNPAVGTGTTSHPLTTASNPTSSVIIVIARTQGTAGNSIAVGGTSSFTTAGNLAGGVAPLGIAQSQTYPANFEMVGSFTSVHCATGGVRALFASERK